MRPTRLLAPSPAALLVPALVATLGLAHPAHAQPDYCLLKTSPGLTGQTLSYSYEGAPAGVLIGYLVDITPGPIPVGLVCSGDLRSLLVGVNLTSAWMFGLTSPTGTGAFGLPIPGRPSYAGVNLYAHSFTFGSGACFIDKISNNVTTWLGNAGTWARLGATLPTARVLAFAAHTRAGACPTGDIVLIAGGPGPLTAPSATPAVDIYEHLTLTTRANGTSTAGALGTATTLDDGRVLIAGGTDTTGAVINTCVIYDPADNSFSPTGGLNILRAGHAATLLPGGDVLVVGGITDFSVSTTALRSVQKTAERWSKTTGQWTQVADMQQQLLFPALVTLNTGLALRCGGYEIINATVLGQPVAFPGGTQSTCERFDPTNNMWVATPSMQNDRAGHEYNTVVLGDGRVLVTGGGTAALIPTQATPIAKCEAYDPVANSWGPLPDMNSPRLLHTATSMPNGTVVIAGGADGGTLEAPVETDKAERFDPGTNLWTALPNLPSARALHAALCTPDGHLVLLGGQNQSGSLATIDVLYQ